MLMVIVHKIIYITKLCSENTVAMDITHFQFNFEKYCAGFVVKSYQIFEKI